MAMKQLKRTTDCKKIEQYRSMTYAVSTTHKGGSDNRHGNKQHGDNRHGNKQHGDRWFDNRAHRDNNRGSNGVTYLYRKIHEPEEKLIPPIMDFSQLVHTKEYYIDKKKRLNLHIGQRKLFLNELRFLTKYAKKNSIVVYVGAAPCNKAYLLWKLFAELNVKFILIDPNDFEIFTDCFADYGNNLEIFKKRIGHKTKANNIITAPKGSPESYLNFVRRNIAEKDILIINDYMTIEIAQQLKSLSGDVLFISDIRTNARNQNPTNADLLWNSAQQHNWISIMKPRISMLKFRCPFFDKANIDETVWRPEMARELDACRTIDFRKDFKEFKFRYYDGDIWLQSFAGNASSETRLITDGKNIKLYEVMDFEQKLFHYNMEERDRERYINNHVHKRICFAHGNDCAMEAKIWDDYVAKFKPKMTVRQLIEELSFVTNRLMCDVPMRDREIE